MSRRPHQLPFVITVALSATFACSGSTDSDANGSNGGSDAGVTGGNGGVGATGFDGGGLGGYGLSGGDGGSSANPPFVECPNDIPEDGAPCEPDRARPAMYCDYDDPCGGADQIVATCTGVWDVPETACACECPKKKPQEGTPCDPCIVDVCGWGDCSGDAKLSGKCVNGVWDTEIHSCFPGPQPGIDGGFPNFDAGVKVDSGS